MKIDVSSVSSVSQNVNSDTKIQKSEIVDGLYHMNPEDAKKLKVEEGQVLSEMNDYMVEKAIEQANKSLANYDKKIERVVHDVTKTIMYTIRDTKTDEIIKEFPPKKIQDMIAKMWELAGLFVDEKA